jgi:hypothetical protein
MSHEHPAHDETGPIWARLVEELLVILARVALRLLSE